MAKKHNQDATEKPEIKNNHKYNDPDFAGKKVVGNAKNGSENSVDNAKRDAGKNNKKSDLTEEKPSRLVNLKSTKDEDASSEKEDAKKSSDEKNPKDKKEASDKQNNSEKTTQKTSQSVHKNNREKSSKPAQEADKEPKTRLKNSKTKPNSGKTINVKVVEEAADKVVEAAEKASMAAAGQKITQAKITEKTTGKATKVAGKTVAKNIPKTPNTQRKANRPVSRKSSANIIVPQKSKQSLKKEAEAEIKALDQEVHNTQTAGAKLSWKERWKNAKQEREKRYYKHPMPAILRVPLAAVMLAIFSVVITWFIFYRFYDGNIENTVNYLVEKPTIFWYSSLIIFALMGVIAAFTWKPFFTAGLIFSAASIFMFINTNKVNFRGTPLLPEDFMLADQAGNLTDFIDTGELYRLIGGVVLLLIGCIYLEICVKHVIGRNTKKMPWWDRHVVLQRLSFTAVTITMLSMLSVPVMSVDQEADSPIIKRYYPVVWNPGGNYANNGMILGFIFNLRGVDIEKPEDYSRETMNDIAKRYRAIKEADSENRRPINEIADNVIIILEESFYDPVFLERHYVHEGGEVLPNLHKLYKRYPSGYMYSPEYGGGTANVEFEVYTGLSNYWAATTPYTAAVGKAGEIMGAANWLKDYGFETTALHSYYGGMYKRDLIYPLIGFDDFVTINEMKTKEFEPGSGYINDHSTFKETTDITDKSGSQMVGVVTMQNHAGFSSAYDYYQFTMANEEKAGMIGSLQLIHNSDKYIMELVERLNKSKEKTVVLLYGDHVAGLFDKYANSENKNEKNIAHLTPYFIYANFKLKNPYNEKTVEQENAQMDFDFSLVDGVDLPTTSPNCLQNTLYDVLGAEKPALFYLVEQVCRENPILARVYKSPDQLNQTKALHDYELVNYDVLNGKHYWYGD